MLSRFESKKLVKNFKWLAVLNAVTAFMNFVSKSIFLKYLSPDFLGLSYALIGIVGALSIADLGMHDAFMFHLYNPVNDNDVDKTTAIVNYYGKCMKVVSIVVVFVGLCLVPFLEKVLSNYRVTNKVVVYYVMVLIVNASTYWIAYRDIILVVRHKIYITKLLYSVTRSVSVVAECIAVGVFKSFTLYMVVYCLRVLVYNIIMYIASVKELKRDKVELPKEERVELKKSIKDVFVYKFSNVVVKDTDNILTSAIEGVGRLGLISNYNMLVTSVTDVTSSFLAPLVPAVGRFNVDADSSEKYKLFIKLRTVGHIMFGTIGIVFVIIANEFIELWVGKKCVLELGIVFAIGLNIYLSGLHSTVDIYKKTTDLFRSAKLCAVLSAVLNIVISVVLGKKIGYVGIALGTALSGALTVYWYEPYRLYRDYFNKGFIWFLADFVYRCVQVVLCYFCCNLFVKGVDSNPIVNFIIKAGGCSLISIGILLTFNLWVLKDKLKKIVKKVGISNGKSITGSFRS